MIEIKDEVCELVSVELIDRANRYCDRYYSNPNLQLYADAYEMCLKDLGLRNAHKGCGNAKEATTMAKEATTMAKDQVLRYINLVDRKVYILLHSGVDWRPEYGPEMQQIDAELVQLRKLVDATLKNAPDVEIGRAHV